MNWWYGWPYCLCSYYNHFPDLFCRSLPCVFKGNIKKQMTVNFTLGIIFGYDSFLVRETSATTSFFHKWLHKNTYRECQSIMVSSKSVLLVRHGFNITNGGLEWRNSLLSALSHHNHCIRKLLIYIFMNNNYPVDNCTLRIWHHHWLD